MRIGSAIRFYSFYALEVNFGSRSCLLRSTHLIMSIMSSKDLDIQDSKIQSNFL